MVNNLYDTANKSVNANRYPLRVIQDEDLTTKLDTVFDTNDMFSTYLYRSGVSVPFIIHCNKMYYDLQHYIHGTSPPSISHRKIHIVDIGGNDGTLLKAFKKQHNPKFGTLECTNIEASSSFREDNEKEDIEYINSYWGDIELPNKANVIFSTNVFQHNSDVHKFMRGIKKNLFGIWVLEFPYFLRTVQTNQFDQIYHEHYFYWMVTPLVKLFEQYGLGLLSITEHDIHGGTMRIVLTNHHGGYPEIAQKYIEIEKNFDFSKWSEEIKKKILSDASFISTLHGTVACFGAAAKGCVYLNSLGEISNNKISYVVDDTIGKQGKFIPGTSLQVVTREHLIRTQPDFLIVLAHNFKDYIVKSLKPDYKGKIIVMLPEIEIYD